MTTNRFKYPPPVQACGFRFLAGPSLTHAVLEVDTETNPVCVFFSKQQLEKLAVDALTAAFKYEASWTDGSPFGD
jgi:hypothetical protein